MQLNFNINSNKKYKKWGFFNNIIYIKLLKVRYL